MTTIKTIASTLSGPPKHPTKTRCTICGARLPRRKSAHRCESCGVTRLKDAELDLLKLIRRGGHSLEGLVQMLQRIRQYEVEALAWLDGQLQFLDAVSQLDLPDLDLETLIARGYVPEGKILEMYSAAHAATRSERDEAAACAMH